jgi:choline dehydrogenase-like flavoprotein
LNVELIYQSSDITKPLRESADVCIIGSGCGGGPTAKILAEAGKKVIVLEEGGYYTSKDFDSTEATAYQNLYQRRAGQGTDDLAITILQGRSVGGSSTINWTTSLRTPEFVLDAWAKKGIRDLTPKELDPYFGRIERYLNVHSEPEELHNPNNRIILDGGRALGYRVQSNGRNTKDCVRSGACGLGCPYDAKLSVNITYIPDAEKAGATVFSDCRAERITLHGSQKRVSGIVLDRRTGKAKTDFVIEARVVVISGSAVNSPVLLLKSNLANSSGEVGKHLTLHPTSAVVGLFDRIIYPAGGIPQSAMCHEFLNKNNDDGGFWVEAVPVYPVLAALALPGFGKAHRDTMAQYRHFGASIVLVKETDSEGRVTVNDNGRPSISYDLGDGDRQYLRQALGVAAEIHFAAGAKKVMTLHSLRTEMGNSDGIAQALENADWSPNEFNLYSAHPLGSCRMGKDPASSVVNSHCQTHDVKGLFVIDGSVMPTSLGVNPQITILAIAEKSAEWIAENFAKVSS